MQLYKIRGGNEEELFAKKYNIGVGISLGNRWFTVENILGLVGWSLEYTRESVVVYVADSIHALNIEARTGKSLEKSKVITLQQGRAILEQVKEQVAESVSEQSRQRIVYAQWDDIVDQKYQQKVDFLYNLYSSDKDFRGKILDLVNEHTATETRMFDENARTKMAQYILEELPESLCRVKISGVTCDAYAYPFDGPLCIFIEELQRGVVFPEIGNTIIDTEPKVFLEVR
jgi:tRNA-dependent cyclodipeptide synthase